MFENDLFMMLLIKGATFCFLGLVESVEMLLRIVFFAEFIEELRLFLLEIKVSVGISLCKLICNLFYILKFSLDSLVFSSVAPLFWDLSPSGLTNETSFCKMWPLLSLSWTSTDKFYCCRFLRRDSVMAISCLSSIIWPNCRPEFEVFWISLLNSRPMPKLSSRNLSGKNSLSFSWNSCISYMSSI